MNNSSSATSNTAMNPLESYKPPTVNMGMMGYSVEWNPFDEALLAVSTSQHFGIVGTGKQLVYKHQNGVFTETASIETKDGVFDCTWSESVAHHLAYSCGDGTVHLWDVAEKKVLQTYQEHTAEVYSVDWNVVNKENFLTAAWDNTIKLWHPDEKKAIRTYKEHTQCIYQAIWHPRTADMFASVSGDCTLKVWDANVPESVLSIRAHEYEVLSCDWNKYDQNMIYTGSVDKTIRGWDIRSPSSPVVTLAGHDYAVRRLKCSPHSSRVIVSGGYDMALMVWDLGAMENNLLARYEHHTEFVLGIGFNLFQENLLASTSWDETVACWNLTQHMPNLGNNTHITPAPALQQQPPTTATTS